MKILIADDSADNRDLLKHMISQRGHTAIEAADGRAALKKVRTQRPDMVISDAVMPVMDGFQLLKELKTDRDLRGIPFIIVSGLYDSPEERRLAESLGASAFLTKSMRLDEMWGHIESAINNHPPQSCPERSSLPTDEEFREDHMRIVVSKLKEKVEQLEREVDERSKAEKALKQSEERFRKLVESTTDYIYTVEVSKGLPTNTVHGPGCVAVTGYEAEEYEADPRLWIRMIPEEDQDVVLAHSSMVLSGDSPPPLEHRITHKDGRIRWIRNTVVPRFNAKGTLIAYDGLIADITDHKELDITIRNAATEWSVTFDSMADGVSVHGADHTILRVNETLCRILDKSINEILGEKCYRLFHCTDEPISDCPLTKSVKTGEKEYIERFEPTVHGGRWIAISASPVKDEKGRVTKVIHAVRDITEQKKREEQLRRQLQHMAALHSIDLAITSSLDRSVTLGVILDKVTTELAIDAADVLLFNPHLQILEYAYGRGFRTQALRHTHLKIGECYAGKAALERRIITIPDMTETPGEFVRAKLLADEGFVTYHAAPLIAKGQVKGVLELFHRTSFNADDDWQEFLKTLATQAAIAIDSSSMLDELQRSHGELTQAYETTLEGWSRAMDLRDKETEGHCRRVAEMTLRMARAMGISSTDQAYMYRGALLHDIGKIGVPDHILLKPAPLTEEEWAIMKRHTIHAHDLLYPIQFLRPAIDIPYYHHEKWDGSGYPMGLKGEEIPIAARVFAVVDVWDALRSNRPYRPAWPEAKVREYIRSLSGTHFDPKIAEIFLAIEW
ncbi:MAG: PAS domain S-box protein [Nitrospirota bacterium]|nr:PAS domain S-box protein [Nitrospirota bacterium]